jgi:hypothetical protein
MQRMKPNAASARIINRDSCQVVKVNQHSKQKQQVRALPMGFVKNIRHNSRKYQVEKIVNKEYHGGQDKILRSFLFYFDSLNIF